MMWFGQHWFGGWWMMLIFWGGLIALLALGVWAVLGRSSGGRAAPTDHRQDSPLDIVKERYARGEISHEEYQAMRETLTE